MRTITVKGAGTGSVRPDCIRITITLNAEDADYSLAMELANVQTEALQKAVQDAKISAEDLKTAASNGELRRSLAESYASFADEAKG